MSFWRGETLFEKLPHLITPFREDAIDCAAYKLHVGNEIYISPDGTVTSPNRHTKQGLWRGKSFTIPPGQFAFLHTEETVTVPNDALAFISIRARTKFKGLINISGFHVDPGYKGTLLFSVLNAGPNPIHVQQGQDLFLIWYADLDGVTYHNKGKRGFKNIEPELVNGISGEILSIQSLSLKQYALESELRSQSRLMRLLMIPVLLALAGPAIGLISNLWKFIIGG